jgi:hypothetical protein
VIDAQDAPPVEPNKGTLKFTMNLPGGRSIALPIRIGELRKLDGEKSEPYLDLCLEGAMEAVAGDWTLRYSAGFVQASAAQIFNRVDIYPTGGDPRDGSDVDLSQTYDIADRLYNVKLDDSFTALTISPYTGPIAEARFTYTLPSDTAGANPTGSAKVEDTSTIILSHTSHVQDGRVHANQSARFVPGTYRLASVFLSHITQGTGQVCIAARLPDKAAPLTLKPGTNEIQAGAPFKIDFAATRDRDMITLTDVTVTGRLGELYNLPGNGGQTLFAAFIRANGKEQQLAKLEYG